MDHFLIFFDFRGLLLKLPPSFSIERYMYGYDLTKGDEKGEQELKPGDFWVTYLAADKYLVEKLKDELMLGSVYRQNKANVCLLFDQFLKIPFDEVGSFLREEKGTILNEFKKFIQAYSKDAFESESFTEIDEETLIELLRLEFLNLSESDVLKACLRWVNAEVEREGLVATSENKQKVFSQVKPFVRFIDLDYDQLTELGELKDVLPIEELASLFLKMSSLGNRVIIDCKTERQKGRKVYEVGRSSLSQITWSNRPFKENFSRFSINLRANQKVCITSIQTMLNTSVERLELKVFRCEQGGDVPLAFVEFTKYLLDGNWCFQPGRALEIDPSLSYKLVFNLVDKLFEYAYNTTSFSTIVGGDEFKFSLSEFGRYHCIKGFNFCQISNYENAKSA